MTETKDVERLFLHLSRARLRQGSKYNPLPLLYKCSAYSQNASNGWDLLNILFDEQIAVRAYEEAVITSSKIVESEPFRPESWYVKARLFHYYKKDHCLARLFYNISQLLARIDGNFFVQITSDWIRLELEDDNIIQVESQIDEILKYKTPNKTIDVAPEIDFVEHPHWSKVEELKRKAYIQFAGGK